jgi:hypothetical protein
MRRMRGGIPSAEVLAGKQRSRGGGIQWMEAVSQAIPFFPGEISVTFEV